MRTKLADALIGLIGVYRRHSPRTAPCCRYQPTCSEYAIGAIRHYGPYRGSAKAARRLLSCHPWGGRGYDPPVPEAKQREVEASFNRLS